MANIIPQPKVKLHSAMDENGARYFIDTTTRNMSFLQTAADLKKLGIKNNMFFLKLYDRNLVGVDPFSSSLSREQKDRISYECMNNIYYFLRECVRIPEQGGATGPGSGSAFILHRGNLSAAWCFDHNIDFYLVVPRQCYKTMSLLAMENWAYLFGTSNSLFNFVSKTQKDCDDNLMKLKDQKDSLPLFMQQKYTYDYGSYTISGEIKKITGTNNVRCITNPVTKNRIDSKPSALNEAAADALGRGNSAPMQFYDEVEFTPFIGTILKASGPAYYRAAMNAERNEAAHIRMLSSTPRHTWEIA